MAEDKGAKSAGSGDDGLFGALCYIIGILVPLFVLFTDKKQNRFLAFHAWQSLLFTVVAMVLWFGLMMLTVVASFAAGGIGGMIGCMFLPLMCVLGIVALFAAYKAYQGERYKLPVIGDIAEKQASK